MSKPIKIFLAAALALVLLIAAAAVILPMVVDPNDYKDQVAAAVREQTGRTLTFEGDIALSVFPWIGVETGGLRLSNPKGFPAGDMLAVKGVNVKVKLLPLFTGEIVVGTVMLDEPVIKLLKNRKGAGNWEFGVPAAPAAEKPASGSVGLSGLSVGAVDIRNADLTYADLSTKDAYRIGGLNLLVEEVALGSFAKVALTCAVSSKPHELEADIDFKSAVRVSPSLKQITLKDMDLEVQAASPKFPDGNAELSLTGGAEADLSTKLARITGLTLKAMGMTVNADAEVKNFDRTPAFSATVNMPESDIRSLLEKLGMAVPMQDDDALRKVALDLRAQGTPNAVAVPEIKLVLDDTTLTGSAEVKDIKLPAVRFDLNADKITVDRYLPPASEDEKKSEDSESADKDGDILDPAAKEQLRKLVLDGNVKVGALTAKGVTLEDITVTVTARNGKIRINPLSALLYGGRYDGDVTYDVSGATDRTKLDMAIDKVSLGKIINDMTGRDIVSGLTDVHLNLEGTGNTVKTLLKSLAGRAGFAVNEGAFHGFRIVPEDAAQSLATKAEKEAVAKVGKKQSFDSLGASFTIKNGFLSTENLKLISETINADGSGGLNLLTGELDMLADVSLPALPTLPVRATGPITDPSYGVDAGELAKRTVKGVVNAPVDAGEAIIEGGGDALKGIGDGIGNIFGGSKKK